MVTRPKDADGMANSVDPDVDVIHMSRDIAIYNNIVISHKFYCY